MATHYYCRSNDRNIKYRGKSTTHHIHNKLSLTVQPLGELLYSYSLLQNNVHKHKMCVNQPAVTVQLLVDIQFEPVTGQNTRTSHPQANHDVQRPTTANR